MNIFQKALLATTMLGSIGAYSQKTDVGFSGASNTGYNIKKGSFGDLFNPSLGIQYNFGEGSQQISINNATLRPMAIEGKLSKIQRIGPNRRGGPVRSWHQSLIIGNSYTPNDGYTTQKAAQQSPNFNNPYVAIGAGYALTGRGQDVKAQLKASTYVGAQRHQQFKENTAFFRNELIESIGFNVGNGVLIGLFARQAFELGQDSRLGVDGGLTISWDAARAMAARGDHKTTCPAFN